jgi:hypothetical protein
MKPLRWTPRKILLLLLTISFATPAKAEDACRGEADGRVSCTGEGFKILTGLVVQHKARADKCELRLEDAGKDVADLTGLVQHCEAKFAAIPPCPPPRSPLMPLLGVGASVLGSLLMAGGFVAPVPDSVRFPMGLVGLGLIGGGVVLVWP